MRSQAKTHWTKADTVLIAVLVLLTGFLFTRMDLTTDRGDWVVIEVNERQMHRLPLDVNRTVQVQGPIGITEVEVRDGKVRVLRSPCSQKICIKSGYLRYADRFAACLPNRVLVRVVGTAHRGYDAILS